MFRAFVIQIHSGFGELHYDLMLERAEALDTWKLSLSPLELQAGVGAASNIQAQKLPDHRKAYLSYEGPISGNRGEVKILDNGTYELLTESETHIEIQINGRCVQGRFALTRTSEDTDEWIFTRLQVD